MISEGKKRQKDSKVFCLAYFQWLHNNNNSSSIYVKPDLKPATINTEI